MQKDFHIQGPQIHQFNSIAPAPVPRSSFKRDFTRRSTFDANYLVPIFVDEIYPGDDVHIKMTGFARMATPIKPLMDNLYMETHWFFVPFRLLWDKWERFQGEQINPGDSTAFTIPKLDNTKAPLSTTGFAVESIYDYLGLPVLVSNIDKLSALYNRAYDFIWNDWYRDENLQNSLTINTGDGPDDPATYQLRKRNKRKDYFTSGLPWPQKGAAVTLPLTGNIPVTITDNGPFLFKATNIPNAGRVQASANGSGISTPVLTGEGGNSATQTIRDANYKSGLTGTGDASGLTAVTINALRQAALYQQILELDARGGTRYVESIYSRFGVVSPDFRLQRPELIGQGTSRVNIYAVPQTAPTASGQTPQGNLAAFGTNVIQGHGCRYSATEHGCIIGLINVRADLTYQQGVPRMFSRQTRLDFYEPLLNGLGEQAVLKKEIMATGTATDEEVFVYQERFADLRFKNSEITGKFRSAAPQSLNIWHLSQQFGAVPAFNSSFIEENVPMDRVLAVNTEPDFLFDASFDYTHTRPMPMRSNPGITRL